MIILGIIRRKGIIFRGFRIIVFVRKNLYLLLSTIWSYVSYFPTFEAFYIFLMCPKRILRFVFMSFMFPIILLWLILVRIRFTC